MSYDPYRQQLTRYADALQAREPKPIEAWLVALRSGEWSKVTTSSGSE